MAIHLLKVILLNITTKTNSWCKYLIRSLKIPIHYRFLSHCVRWHKVQVTDTTHEVTNLPTGNEIMFKVAAVNCAGTGPTSHNTRYVKIISPGSFSPPVIQEPLSDLSVGLGKAATLQCVITGKPIPDIKW